jgi:hypothetical protein
VGRLVLGNLDKTSSGPAGQARFLKVMLAELGEGAGVEGVLEVLEGESVVEDSGVCEGSAVGDGKKRNTDHQ